MSEPARGPDVKFLLTGDGPRVRLDILGPNEFPQQTASFEGYEADLIAGRRYLRSSLSQFKQKYQRGTDVLTVQESLDALYQLKLIGGQYCAICFPACATNILWILTKLLAPATTTDPTRIEITSEPRHSLAVAFLRSGYCKPVAGSTPECLMDYASSIPLFSSTIRSVYLPERSSEDDAATRRSRPTVDGGLIPQDQTPVRRKYFTGSVRLKALMLWNEKLDETAKDRKLLNDLRLAGLIDLSGPYPDAFFPNGTLRQAESEREIARRLASPGLVMMAGQSVPTPLVHVSAHSTVDAEGISEMLLSRLKRTGPFGRQAQSQEYLITSEQLQSLWDDDDTPMQRGPLCVLSSCESVADEWKVSSFAALLLRAGYRAIVGAETNVGDQLANLFFRYFYRHLFEDTLTTVGEAVRLARCDLLKEVPHSPLGCLFGVRGDTDLTLNKIGE